MNSTISLCVMYFSPFKMSKMSREYGDSAYKMVIFSFQDFPPFHYPAFRPSRVCNRLQISHISREMQNSKVDSFGVLFNNLIMSLPSVFLQSQL